jgi:hypothetical protein
MLRSASPSRLTQHEGSARPAARESRFSWALVILLTLATVTVALSAALSAGPRGARSPELDDRLRDPVAP